MDQFTKKFASSTATTWKDAKIPVACSLANFFQSQLSRIGSAAKRQEQIKLKNARVSASNLQERQKLDQKLRLLQEAHAKKRTTHLQSKVKQEKMKINYVKERNEYFKQTEQQMFKAKLTQFKTFQQSMKEYWDAKESATRQKFKSQTSVTPVYENAFKRKLSIQSANEERSLKTKEKMLRKHTGRDQAVKSIFQKKRLSIHEPHQYQMQQVLQKSQQIQNQKKNNFIKNIVMHFDESAKVLSSNQKKLEKKIKDKLIDEANQIEKVKNNCHDHYKTKINSLSSCKCKRINNQEEKGLTKSIVMMENLKHKPYSQAIKHIYKSSSPQRSKFSNHSSVLFQSVMNNKEIIKEKKNDADQKYLKREQQIAAANELKKKIQIEGNSALRKSCVK